MEKIERRYCSAVQTRAQHIEGCQNYRGPGNEPWRTSKANNKYRWPLIANLVGNQQNLFDIVKSPTFYFTSLAGESRIFLKVGIEDKRMHVPLEVLQFFAKKLLWKIIMCNKRWILHYKRLRLAQLLAAFWNMCSFCLTKVKLSLFRGDIGYQGV